ncbi:hypothetical protein ICW40_20080 [Actinotalea ferrariae]|uniref:hypothetical protein n=1 Tax=Actinotalea ferrariae TaxID=1386098 RepID=UPI001C8C0596|nr:hypothetical protein [Actinotalea ferrariae]MBX9247094.1 hypothetical protein [Actinotalea ferrariae]
MTTNAPASLARTLARSTPVDGRHLDAAQVTAIHRELRAAASARRDGLDRSAATDLYSGLATVALLDHLRGAQVSHVMLRSLARHSATARQVLSDG